jgi:acyl-CoA thioester hydrolase
MSILYRPEIRFADIDSYGIVHNANYLIYFEQSRIVLFNKISDVWDWKKHGVLVARQEVDYKHPVKLNDVLEIEVWVEKIGDKSLTIGYNAHILKNDRKTLAAQSRTVIVCFDVVSGSTTPIPQSWRQAIHDVCLLKV